METIYERKTKPHTPPVLMNQLYHIQHHCLIKESSGHNYPSKPRITSKKPCKHPICYACYPPTHKVSLYFIK